VHKFGHWPTIIYCSIIIIKSGCFQVHILNIGVCWIPKRKIGYTCTDIIHLDYARSQDNNSKLDRERHMNPKNRIHCFLVRVLHACRSFPPSGRLGISCEDDDELNAKNLLFLSAAVELDMFALKEPRRISWKQNKNESLSTQIFAPSANSHLMISRVVSISVGLAIKYYSTWNWNEIIIGGSSTQCHDPIRAHTSDLLTSFTCLLPYNKIL